MIGAENTDKDRIKEDLNRLVDYTRNCKMRIFRGEPVDMSGMDEKTAVICENLAKLPHEEARSLAPLLRQLIENLNAMEKDLLG